MYPDREVGHRLYEVLKYRLHGIHTVQILEQSKPDGVVPPHRYGTPRYLAASVSKPLCGRIFLNIFTVWYYRLCHIFKVNRQAVNFEPSAITAPIVIE